MKKTAASAILLCLSATLCAAQKTRTATPKPSIKPKQTTAKPDNLKTPVSSAVKPKPTAAVQQTTEIRADDWKVLTDALSTEDWNKSANLSSRYISRLKNENEKKQLARLRYFYLYSLSGKILDQSAKNPAGDKARRDALKKAAAAFTGEEFVLPPREYRDACRQIFNYICAVKNNERAFRTAATSRAGTEIISFDYVSFDRKVEVLEIAGKKIFLGGVLRKAEFNDDSTKPWVMRLIFDKGFVRVAPGE